MSAVAPANDAAAPRDHARLSSLDGLRAISIALVIFEHLRRTRGYTLGDLNAYFGDYGRLGVTVFFVISGFLITTLLLRERERRGSISLKGFYLRRAVRIFPAFLAFMAFIIVAHEMGWIQLNRYDLVSAFTYTVNYHPGRSWYIGHLWSLSVEEQFYLLWPLALVVLSRTRALAASRPSCSARRRSCASGWSACRRCRRHTATSRCSRRWPTRSRSAASSRCCGRGS